jgi:CBS domain-containing protein
MIAGRARKVPGHLGCLNKKYKEGRNVNTPINQLLMQKGRDIITIAPTATVFEAIQLMDSKNIGSLLILNAHGKIAGIFCERDCFRKVLLAGKSPHDAQVKNVMTKKVIYATPETTVDECMAVMTQKRIRHMPVLDAHEKILGIISIGDLVKFVASEQDAMIRNLEKYIEGSL